MKTKEEFEKMTKSQQLEFLLDNPDILINDLKIYKENKKRENEVMLSLMVSKGGVA